MATKRWSVLGFKMKKSAPLPSGPRKAGLQNNGTVPHDSSTSGDNSSTSDIYEGTIDLNVILPGGKNVQMSVESKVPMMDLLIQVTVPNKINPAGHVIQAPTETGNSYITYKPSTPIGALGTNTICVVPKNLVTEPPRKIGPKVANQPFEQTFRLQVHLPQNQKTFLRVSPKTLLAEILSLVCKEKGFEPIHYDIRDPARPNEPLELGRSLSEYKLHEVQLVPTNVPDFRKSTSDLVYAQQMSQAYHPPPSKDDTKEKSKKKSIFPFKITKRRNKSSQDQKEVIGEWSFRPASSCGSESSQPGSLRSTDSSRPALSRPLTTIVTSTNITRPPSHKKRPAPPPPVQKPPAPVHTSSPLSKNDSKDEAIHTKEQNETNHSRHSSDSSGYHEASILSDSPENSTGDSLGHVRPPSRLRTGFDDTSLDSMEINSSKMPSPVAICTTKQTLKAQVSDTESSGHSNTSTLNKKRRAPNPPVRPPPPVIKTSSGDKTLSSEETANKSRPPRPLPPPVKTDAEFKEKCVVTLREKPRPVPRPRSSVDEDMKIHVSPRPRRPCSFVAPPPPPLPDSPSDLPSPVDFSTVLGKSSSQTDVATETMQEFKTTCDKGVGNDFIDYDSYCESYEDCNCDSVNEMEDLASHEVHGAYICKHDDIKESHDVKEDVSDTSTTSVSSTELHKEFQATIVEAEAILEKEKQIKSGPKSEMARFVESMTSMTIAIEEDSSQQVSTESDGSKQGDPSEGDTVIEMDTDKEEKRIKVPKRREKRIIDKQILKTSEEHETSSEEDNQKIYTKVQKHVPLTSTLSDKNHELMLKVEETSNEQVSNSNVILDSNYDQQMCTQKLPQKLSPMAAPRKLHSDNAQEKANKKDRQKIPYETGSLPRPIPRKNSNNKKHVLRTSDDSSVRYETKLESNLVKKEKIMSEYPSAKKENIYENFPLDLPAEKIPAAIDYKDKLIADKHVSNIIACVTIEETVEIPCRVKVLEEETDEKVIKSVKSESVSDLKHDNMYSNKDCDSSDIIETIKNNVKDQQEKEIQDIEKDEKNFLKHTHKEENDIVTTLDHEENAVVKQENYSNAPLNGLIESDHNGEEKKIILDQKLTEKGCVEELSSLDKKQDFTLNEEVSTGNVELSENQKRLQEQYILLQRQSFMWQQQLLHNQAFLLQTQLLPEEQLKQLQEQQALLQQTLFNPPLLKSMFHTSLETQTKTALTNVNTEPVSDAESVIPTVGAQDKSKDEIVSSLASTDADVQFSLTTSIESEQKIVNNEENRLTSNASEAKVDFKEYPPSFPFKKITPQVVSNLEKLTCSRDGPIQQAKNLQEERHIHTNDHISETQTEEIDKKELQQSPKPIYRKWEPPSVVIGSWAERPRDNIPIKTHGTKEIKVKPSLFPKTSSIHHFSVSPVTTSTTAVTVSDSSQTQSIISSTSNIVEPSVFSDSSLKSMPLSVPVISPPAIVPVSLGPKPFKATWKPFETLPKPAPKPAPVVLGFGQRIGFKTLDSDVRTAYRSYSRSVGSIENENVQKNLSRSESSPWETQEVFKFSDTSDSESKSEFPETNRVKHAISKFSNFTGSQPTLAAPSQSSLTVRSLSPPVIPFKTASLNSLNKLETTETDSKYLKTNEQTHRKTQSMHSISSYPSSPSSVLSSSQPIHNVNLESSSHDHFKTVIKINQVPSESKIVSSNSDITSFNPPPPPFSNFVKGSLHTLPKTASAGSNPRFKMVKDSGVQSVSSGDSREELMNAIRSFGGRQQLKKVPLSQASWHFGTSN